MTLHVLTLDSRKPTFLAHVSDFGLVLLATAAAAMARHLWIITTITAVVRPVAIAHVVMTTVAALLLRGATTMTHATSAMVRLAVAVRRWTTTPLRRVVATPMTATAALHLLLVVFIQTIRT